jgi:hypothetical protein
MTTALRQALVVVLAAVTFGCGDDPPDDLVRSATIDRTVESDEMAMWLARTPEPPPELSSRIAAELELLRETFGEAIPRLREIRFQLPWERDQVWLVLESALYDSLLAGVPTAVDEVNSRLGGRTLGPHGSPGLRWCLIQFDRTVHPGCLVGAYRGLSGVRYSEVNYYAGDWSNIYPRLDEDESRYLLMNGDGDCPAGCTENDFWYFRVLDGQAIHVGTWEHAEAGSAPAWFAEALELRHAYRHHGSSCAGTP